MDIHMASLPGCGLGGGGGGGGGDSGKSMRFKLRQTIQNPVGPQVKFVSGQPPVLDTAGCKPSTSRPSSGLCGSTRRVGGNLWTSIRNMYNSIRSGPSLTWVNPGMISEFHPAATQSLNLDTPLLVADAQYVNQNQPLWYPATPGSQFCYEDPLQALPCPFPVTLPPYSNNLTPCSTYSYKKSSQPLNPEAKEWVPSDYKDNRKVKSSMPNSSELSPDKYLDPKVSSEDVTDDFTEITESEIDEARKNSNNKEPKQTQDSSGEESSNKQLLNLETKLLGSCLEPQMSSTSVLKVKSNQEIKSGASSGEVQDPSPEQHIFYDSTQTDCSAKEYQSNMPASYASIIRKSPEPLVKAKVTIAPNEKSTSSSECVKQPLPKIFMKDKIYPKEKAPLVMENKKNESLPFKTASKTQKKSSKKFLRDLKEISPIKSDCSFSGSECSLESNSEIMSRLCMSSSPVILGLHGNELTKENSEIMSRLCMSSSPVILGLHGNEFTKEKTENVRSQRSLSESSVSSTTRTVSESTVSSVDSIDIDFEEDCDIHENKRDDLVADHCQNRGTVEDKYKNSIVAHILCFDDSESEDSDNDSDDSDWDTVQECISHDADDSWETFGLVFPLITKSSPCSGLGNNDVNISEIVCDNICNSSLKEINKKWDEEVCREVQDASPCKVSFGEVKVYPMISWSFAYRTARRGPWEQFARDRSRFSNRILSLEPIISPVLADDHRKAMYCKIQGL